MPNRTTEPLNFGRIGRRHLEANFEGGDLSSDGGLMLLRQIDARTGLSRMAANALTERRAGGRIQHRLRDVLAQRLYGLCCGYEDLNDHDTLRSDLLMQTAVGRDQPLASSPTLSRLEYGAQGVNPRFVVTNIVGSEATYLYECLYCARGEAENRIKEAQLDLFGTRASCHKFAANQFRLLLAALAYTLMQRLRELALKGTELERACAATIRVRLLKIGAAIVRNTRRIRILLASHHPLRHVFAHAVHAMAP